MDELLGHAPYKRSECSNYRNGKKSKTIHNEYGEMEINASQDRENSFEFKIVRNRQKDILGIKDKIIDMYTKRLTTRKISEQIVNIYD